MKTRSLALLILSAALTGCVSFSIERGSLRGDQLANILIDDDLRITAIGEVDTIFNKKLTPFFPSSFLIEAGEKTIYIDPLFIDDPKPADLILITHGHEDHLSLPEIQKLVTEETHILCPKTAAKTLKGFNIRIVKPGEAFILEGLGIETVAAYTEKPIFLWIHSHPRGDDNVGYVLNINGTRLYHAGDTDSLPELQSLQDIDVAFLPLSGAGLTMGATEAAELAKLLNPSMVIPMHFDLEGGDLGQFIAALDPGIPVAVLRSGE